MIEPFLYACNLVARLCIMNSKEHTMSDAVGYMTGALLPEGIAA